MSRVFVSSVAAISCAGNGNENFWEGINNRGRRLNSVKMPIDLPQNIENRIARRMDRYSRMALSVSLLALGEDFPNDDEIDKTRVGTVFNTAYGPIVSSMKFGHQLMTEGVEMVSPILFASTVHNAGIGHTCLNLSLKGASTMLCGSNVIGYAADLLKSNKADSILCVGLEEYCPELYESFSQKSYISKDTDFICRPLDKNRSGTRMLEGSGAIVLKNESAFQENPDQMICEVLGYASIFSKTSPVKDDAEIQVQDFVKVMRMALDNASVQSNWIDGIIMSAAGGKTSDLSEAEAIHEIFGNRTATIPVSSIKGAIGETAGASFALNVIAGSLAILKGAMPLTVGYESADDALNLDIVHDSIRQGAYRYILVNGYDISGGMFSVVLGSIGR